MPLPSDKTYPTVATNAAWQKKKSLIDKVGATNVGAALTTAKTKWDAIVFADLDATKTAVSVATAQQKLTKGKAAWQNVVTARAALKSAWLLADTAVNGGKLTGTSKTALKEISTALKAADKRLDGMHDAVPAFEIDLRNTTMKAAANWTNLEVRMGSQILAHAKAAKQASDKSYNATGVDWKVPAKMTLDYLQKDVKVSAHDGTGVLVNHDMKIIGVSGNGDIHLK